MGVYKFTSKYFIALVIWSQKLTNMKFFLQIVSRWPTTMLGWTIQSNWRKFSSLFFRIGLFKNFHKKIFTSYVLPQWYGKHRISGRINTVFHRVTPNHHLFPPGQEGSTPFSTRSGRFNTCLLPCQLFCPFLLPGHFRVKAVWIFPYEWGRTFVRP